MKSILFPLFLRLIRIALRLCFDFRAYHLEALNTPGPLLLVPNHLSWIDWLFLGSCLDPDWRFVTSQVTAQNTFLHRWIMVNRRTFPVDTASPYAARHMAQYLARGGRLVLFAEGRMSLTGSLMKLFDGTGFLIEKSGARVITAYLRGANRLRWARHAGWKRWWPRVSLHFSPVLSPPDGRGLASAAIRRQITDWLRDRILEQQLAVEMEHGAADVLTAILDMARQRPGQVVLEDYTRQTITYRRLLTSAGLLAKAWRNRLDPDRARMGVLLPNTNAMPAVLLSLWGSGKIPAILNYTSGLPAILAACRLAGLRQVITSRVFLERARLSSQPLIEAGLHLVYLEDIRASISRSRSLLALVCQWIGKGRGLRKAARRHCRGGEPAVILYTSGSEGEPKGVELIHANLLANIRQMLIVSDLEDHDRMFNALPLFHSFGLTVGALLPLVRGLYVFLYPSPLHYRVVPYAVYDRCCTIMLSTNTFLKGYARFAHPYDFRTLRYLFAGAEKVQDNTRNIYARRFGVRILEGYGVTECSPCLSVNVPMANREGSAGRFMPGLEHRIEPVEGVPEGGRLWVRGPNIMRGYLNPDANAQFQATGGWYDTGDIVRVDADGFVFILGRVKRFAKISGEMVSLTAIEDALAGAFPDMGHRCTVAVLAAPDPVKGEAIVAVANESRLTLDRIRRCLQERGCSNLSLPRELKTVHEIPKLGTGKIDHRALAAILRNP